MNGTGPGPPPGHAIPVSYQVNWEIQALDQTAGFLRDDRIGVAALWDTVGQRAHEPRPPESFPYGSPDLRRLRAGHGAGLSSFSAAPSAGRVP